MGDALPLFDHMLRDYQKVCQDKIRAGWASGYKRLLAEMPTGTGKTRTFVLLPREGSRTLVIVPMIELIGQAVRAIDSLRQCEADVEQADLTAIPDSEFIVASWQTLLRNGRYRKFLGRVDTIIVDEAHWGFTVQARDILNEFVDRGARVVGFTATAYRGDKQSLLGFYENLAYCYGLREAINDGYLVSPKVKVHYIKSINLSNAAKKSSLDFNPEELDRILRAEQVLHDIAALITQNHVAGRQAIVFAHSVKQACLLRDLMLDRHGVPCSLVHSYQSDAEYEEEIAAFTNGSREIIINVGILTTGWDHPPVSEVFLAKPTKALNKYVQMVGRATRTWGCDIDAERDADGRKRAIANSPKPHFIVHDLTDSSRCHKLVSAIDILASQPRGIMAKVKRRAEDEEMTADEIDAAVAEELAAEQEAARLEREAERKRRAQLIVGVEFGSEDRDPFANPDRDQAKRREFRMPFGKYRGVPLRSSAIPTSYLEWAFREGRLNPMWQKAIGSELHNRRMSKKFGVAH